MTPRLQKLRLRMLGLDFSICHVPGKHMCSANVLSRHPLQMVTTDLQAAVKEYKLPALKCLPASTSVLDKIKTELTKDTTTASVKSYCSNQCPKKKDLLPEIQKYAGGWRPLSGELPLK